MDQTEIMHCAHLGGLRRASNPRIELIEYYIMDTTDSGEFDKLLLILIMEMSIYLKCNTCKDENGPNASPTLAVFGYWEYTRPEPTVLVAVGRTNNISHFNFTYGFLDDNDELYEVDGSGLPVNESSRAIVLYSEMLQDVLGMDLTPIEVLGETSKNEEFIIDSFEIVWSRTKWAPLLPNPDPFPFLYGSFHDCTVIDCPRGKHKVNISYKETIRIAVDRAKIVNQLIIDGGAECDLLPIVAYI